MIKEVKRFIKKLRKQNEAIQYRSGWDLGNSDAISLNNFVYQGTADSVISTHIGSTTASSPTGDARIERKPVEIFQEIISEEPKMDLENLDYQIKLVERRKKFLQNDLELNATDEVEALAFLKARKKFKKVQDKFKWAITTTTLINQLCTKYKVRAVEFSGYYKNVPMEAIDELEKFVAAYESVRSDKPVLKLIIDEGGKETKKDPILLASSPFGKYWYVLGAWDKEVEIVDDLIYNGK